MLIIKNNSSINHINNIKKINNSYTNSRKQISENLQEESNNVKNDSYLSNKFNNGNVSNDNNKQLNNMSSFNKHSFNQFQSTYNPSNDFQTFGLLGGN